MTMPDYRTILMMGAAFGLSLGGLAAGAQAAEIKRGVTITVARSD